MTKKYKDNPIEVEVGERVRMYVLNAGPSIWSAFHVIGTVLDRSVIEGAVGHDAQTINLAPSQGGWIEFTLDEEGGYPFVDHSFGNMVKGSLGVLKTPNAPEAGGGHNMGGSGHAAAAAPAEKAAAGGQTVEGEMFIKADTTEVKADSTTINAKLEPGNYELVCFVPGHYAAGQKLAFKVTQ